MTQDGGPDALSRDQGVALWRQIVRSLEAEISNGAMGPGDRLQTEAQLSERFGVNRHTVRRALDELSRQGLIRVEQGRGSFVAEPSLDYEVVPRTRFSEWIRRHNKEPRGQLLELREIAAEGTAASALGVRPGTRLIRYDRLGFADDLPVCFSSHHFAAARFPDLPQALRTSDSITAALAACGVADYWRLSTRVTARMPQAREAELLRASRVSPLLVTENVNVDIDGTPIEFGVSRYPTPRVQMVFEP